jgi:hypothetical protein
MFRIVIVILISHHPEPVDLTLPLFVTSCEDVS